MTRQLIESLFRTIDANAVDTLPEFFHPHVVYERPGYPPMVGLDALLRFYRSERVIAGGKHHLEFIIIEGDNGASTGRFIGTRKDGAAVDERFTDIYTLEDGKIRMRRTFFFRPAV